MAKHNSEPDEYAWLFDDAHQPSAEATPHRHTLRRALLLTAAAVVLAGAAVVADNLEKHQDNSGLSANPSNTASASPSPHDRPSPKPTPKPPTQLECIGKLPLSLKLAQKLMISADANTVTDISAVAAEYDLGGVILMGPTPSAAATHDLQKAQTYPLLVTTDQEGGTVQRYVSGGTLPAASDVPSLWSVTEARHRAETSDRYLKSQGVNMNLAPVADVAPAGGNSVLGSRIFSSDPAVVARYAGAYVQAGLTNGVLPTLKHFPGLGAATGNTDFGIASSPAELGPYKALAGTKAAVMVGNQLVPNISDGLPASLSSAVVTDLLRGQLGYENNVVITDSLSAEAITQKYTIAQAAVRAWEAGADISLAVTYQPGLTAEQQVSQILDIGKTAVKSGQLDAAVVNRSIERLWSLPQKHIDACTLVD
jgi:beta-N-acetylhexosaminidase